MESKLRDEALVLIAHADGALQHFAFGKVPAGFAKERPIPVDEDRCREIDLFLFAERGIGRARGQLQIAQVDG